MMLPPFVLGWGGVIGSGTQYMSWIAIDDLVRAIQFILHHDDATGAFNATSPNPVTNREFTKTLGKVLGRSTVLGVPAFAARWLFGPMADELLLASTRVSSPSILRRSAFGSLIQNSRKLFDSF